MPHTILTVTRWLARATALVVVGGYALIVSAEIWSPHSGSPSESRELLGIALLTLAIVCLAIAWTWEAAGAIASLAILGAFLAVIGTSFYQLIAIPAIPSVLYLLDWVLRRWSPTAS